MEPQHTFVPPPPAPRKTSPWVYVGCGCALLVLILAGAGVLVFKKISEEGHKFHEGMTNPKVREERAKALLAYSDLPPGYYPAGALSIPFVFDMVMLGDHATAGTGQPDLGDHGFVFIKMRLGRMADSAEGRRRMLSGINGQSSWEQGSGLHIDSHETLGDGEIDGGGTKLLYRATRGDIQLNKQRHRGISCVIVPECPDRRIRIGIWFAPDPAPDQPASSLDKTGTPADPRAIAAFADHFRLCAQEGE